MLAVASAAFNALGLLAVRQLGATEASATTLFYFSASSAVLTAGLGWANWRPIAAGDVTLVLLIGLSGGLAQYLTIETLRIAPPSVVTPVQYSFLVWASIFELLLWAVWPDSISSVGIALILFGSYMNFSSPDRRKNEEE